MISETFEIEGMSLGDSLLDYYSSDEIESIKKLKIIKIAYYLDQLIFLINGFSKC